MPPDEDGREEPAAGGLDRYVRRLLEDTELPVFSRQLLELLALSNDDHTSAQALAKVVLDDYALTLKVLRVSNSFHYNRSNHPIESIAHAIVVLGMRTVQRLASTLSYFQSFEQRPHGLQQLMIRSMLAAHVASLAASVARLPHREEAYLAGMLQNLGEVLVARRSPDRHGVIQRRIEAGWSPAKASMRELGFTYDELARAASQHWKLSPSLLSLWDPDDTTTDLTALGHFGTELTRLMCLGSAAHREAGISLLLMRYGSRLRLTGDGLADIWDRARDDTRATFATLSVAIDALGSPTATWSPN